MADQHYRVMVVELDDVKPRNESGLPNLLSLITVSTPEERFARLIGLKPSRQPSRRRISPDRRTLPLALNLSTVRDTKDAKGLFVEACERIASDAHTVNRDNDYFIGRKRGRHSQNQRG